MAKVTEKIALLKELREYPDKYLPMVDHAWRTFSEKDEGTKWYDDTEYNIGWDAGLLEGNRPYFLECWATNGITMLTYFVSTDGIGEATDEDLIKMLEKADLFRILDPSRPRAQVMKFDSGGKEFFSVNITAGDENGTYVEGGSSYSFRYLNEFNEKNSRKE